MTDLLWGYFFICFLDGYLDVIPLTPSLFPNSMTLVAGPAGLLQFVDVSWYQQLQNLSFTVSIDCL